MAATKDNKLAWGVSLLVFGVLFFIKQLNIVSPEVENFVFDLKNYPLILGIIFLLFHSNKSIGLVLLVVALLFRLSDIIHLTRNLSNFIWPLLLILAGAILVFGKKGRF